MPPNQFCIKSIPANFQQTQEHLDSNPGKTGLKLFKQIQSTAWSRKENISGVPIEHLRLVDILNRGYNDEGLRFISHGYEQNLVLVREKKDAIFLSYLMKSLRTRSFDVDQLAANAHRLAGQSVPDKTTQAESFMQPLVDAVLNALAPFASYDQPDSATQAELQRLREDNIRLAAERATMTPRKPKELPLEDATDKDDEANKKLGQQFIKKAFSPPPMANKFLENSVPKDEKRESFKKWLQEVKREIKEEESKVIDEFIQAVKEQWQKAPPAKRASLPDLAAKYGMPVKYAGKWKDDNLITCIAVAAFRTF